VFDSIVQTVYFVDVFLTRQTPSAKSNLTVKINNASSSSGSTSNKVPQTPTKLNSTRLLYVFKVWTLEINWYLHQSLYYFVGRLNSVTVCLQNLKCWACQERFDQ